MTPTSDSAINEDGCDVVCRVILTDTCSVVTCTELKNTINGDVVCTKLLTYLNTGWPEAKKLLSVAVQPYFLIRHELSVHEGIIYRGERAEVPVERTSRLVIFANESHQVIVRTKLRLRDLYWWQVTKAVIHCLNCQMADMCAVTRVAPMHPVTHAERYTLSLTDYRSKWPEIAFA